MRALAVERSALGMLALIYRAYVSVVVLAAGVLVLNIGLVGIRHNETTDKPVYRDQAQKPLWPDEPFPA